MKKALLHLSVLNKTSRIFRTFLQATLAYLSVNIFTIISGTNDMHLAIQTLVTGAIAAGFAAIWKTPQNPNQETDTVLKITKKN